MKNTHGGVLLLIIDKSSTPLCVFFAFLKLCNWYQIAIFNTQRIAIFNTKLHGRDVFRTLANVCDKVFLWQELTAFSRKQFSPQKFIRVVKQGPKQGPRFLHGQLLLIGYKCSSWKLMQINLGRSFCWLHILLANRNVNYKRKNFLIKNLGHSLLIPFCLLD